MEIWASRVWMERWKKFAARPISPRARAASRRVRALRFMAGRVHPQAPKYVPTQRVTLGVTHVVHPTVHAVIEFRETDVLCVLKTYAVIGDASCAGFRNARELLETIPIWRRCYGVAGVGN